MTDPMTVLIFSLAVGFVQILVGMVVQFWLLCRDGKIMDAIWDVGTWWVIFAGIALFALNMTGISNVGSAGGIPVVLIIGVVMLLAQGRSAKGFEMCIRDRSTTVVTPWRLARLAVSTPTRRASSGS